MNVLHFFDGDDPAATAGFRRILVTEPEHPYVGSVVAARSRAGLRARLHPPGRRPGHRHRQGRGPARRRSPTACRCSGCSPPSSAAPPTTPPSPDLGRTSAPRHSHARSGARHEAAAIDEDFSMPAPSPCSPASGPTCRSRRCAGWPPGGATTAWRSPAGATTSTSSAPRTTTPTCRSGSSSWSGTACRCSRSPTTSTARRSATTRSTSGTAAWCTRASGATATPRASGSGRPRR